MVVEHVLGEPVVDSKMMQRAVWVAAGPTPAAEDPGTRKGVYHLVDDL